MKKSLEQFISSDRFDDTIKSKSQSILSSDITIPEKIEQLKSLLPEALKVQFDTDRRSIHDFVQSVHHHITQHTQLIEQLKQTVGSEIILIQMEDYHNLLSQLYTVLSSPEMKIMYLTQQIQLVQGDIKKLMDDQNSIATKIESYENLNPLFDMTKLVDQLTDYQMNLSQQSEYQKILSHKELYSINLSKILNKLSLGEYQTPYNLNDILKDISPIESFEEGYDTSLSLQGKIISPEDKKVQKTLPVKEDIVGLVLSELGITPEYLTQEDNAVYDQKKDLLYIFLHDHNITVSCSDRFGIGTVVYDGIVTQDDIENITIKTLKEKYSGTLCKIRKDGNETYHLNMLERVRESIEQLYHRPGLQTQGDRKEMQNSESEKKPLKIIPNNLLPQSSADIIFNKQYTSFVSSIDHQKKKINIILGGTKENPVRGFIHLLPEFENIEHKSTIKVQLEHIYPDNGHMRFKLVR